MRNCILMLFAACSLFSCSKYDEESESQSEIDNVIEKGFVFSLTDNEGNAYYPFISNDSIFHFIIPHNVDIEALVEKLSYDNRSISRYQIYQEDAPGSVNYSDFVHPVRIKVSLPDGSCKDFKVILYDIPVMVIETSDGMPIISKTERKEDCLVRIITDQDVEELGYAGIKGRGNSTWLYPKKPYNLKFEKKQSVLGMNRSKHWLLMSHPHFDRSQLHNATAFEMARLTDYPWVQEGRFVELVLNGEHKGLYYVCEKIRVEKDKINIQEMSPEDNDGENLTGGYLLETVQENKQVDSFSTIFFNKTGKNDWSALLWICDSPDQEDGEMTNEQLTYIKNYLNYVESLMYTDDSLATGKYRDYFDIETAINWVLVEEAALCIEASASKNLFMYKDRGDKMFRIGPPWDFDAWTFGVRETDYLGASQTALYYKQLFKDPVFVNRLKEKWNNYKVIWREKIPIYIDNQASYIRNAALRNEVMWPDWDPVNSYPSKSWDQLIVDMKTAFLDRLEWLDNQFENL